MFSRHKKPDVTSMPSDAMWDDAGHPGWDLHEAMLDALPRPEPTGEVAFARSLQGDIRKQTAVSLYLRRKFKKTHHRVCVLVYQRNGRSGMWRTFSSGLREVELAERYCRDRFEAAGFIVTKVSLRVFFSGTLVDGVYYILDVVTE